MKKIARIWKIVCCFLVPVLISIWKLPPIGAKRYHTFTAGITAFRSGDFYAFWLQSKAGPLLMLCYILALGMGILFLIRGILSLRQKEFRWLNYISRIICALAMYMALIPSQSLPEQERAGYFTIVCICIIPLVEYIGFRYFDEWKEQMDAYRELQRKEQEEKRRRKKALYFPGSYPKELRAIIWENFKGNFRSGGLLIFGAAMCAVYITVIIGLNQVTIPLTTGGEVSKWLILLLTAAGTGGSIFVLCIMLMYYNVSNYTKNRKEYYRRFLVLGIRTRTIYLIFAAEYMLSLAVSYVIGMTVGSVCYLVIRHFFGNMEKEITLPGVFSVEIFGFSSLIYILILILATMFNQENILEMGNSTVLYEDKKADKIPVKIKGKIIVGVMLFYNGWNLFRIRAWTENWGSYLAIGASLFFFLSVGLIWYQGYQKQKQKHILQTNVFFYRFRRNRWNTFLFTIIHFCIFVVVGIPFLTTAIAPEPEKLYPYDIVCMAYDQDVEQLNKIASEHHAKSSRYPMVRVTARYASDSLQSHSSLTSVLWPQGQNTGISETTYKELKQALGKKAKQLNLKGEALHIVYQEDVSMSPKMIETSGNRQDYRMRFGQPLNQYDNVNRYDVFPKQKVVSEEKDILTGTFCEGQQENLVVLSDEYFEKVYKEITQWNQENIDLRMQTHDAQWDSFLNEHGKNMTEGPTELFLFDVPEEEYKEMMNDLTFLAEKYPMDTTWDATVGSVYGAETYIKTIEPERIYQQIIQILIMAILLSFGMLQAYIKTESETDEIVWQSVFLQRIGMRERDRKKMIKNQIQSNFLISICISGVVSVAMWASMCSVRYFQMKEILSFAGAAVLFFLLYTAIWEVWLWILEKRVWKLIQKIK